MFDWLIRRWRVEVALFRCYFEFWDRKESASFRYCKDKSIFVTVFWIVVLFALLGVVGFLLGVSPALLFRNQAADRLMIERRRVYV